LKYGGDAKSVEAERRQISVMYCDLVGSTALSEELDPEDMTEVILAYRSVVKSIATSFLGYVANYIGDGLLIYFGYPQAREDDAVRAVRAALQILEEVRALTSKLKLPIGWSLRAHIGIHTGLVVVGAIGRGAIVEHGGAVGEAPNIAARLEKLAAPDTVLITGATFDLVTAHFHCTRLDPQSIEGISKAIDVYLVDQKDDHHSSWQRLSARDPVSLVGRAAELTLLLDGWAAAMRENGDLLVLSGEPGIGKSRLVRALTEAVVEQGAQILICHCVRENAESAFFPIIQMLRAVIGLGPSGDHLDDYDCLRKALDALAMPEDALHVLAPFLLVVVPSDAHSLAFSPEGLRQRMLQILTLWLCRLTEQKAVLFVVEDIHWADASTLEWLTVVSQHVATAKLLTVLTVRSEFRQPLSRLSRMKEVPLDRLQTDDMLELLGLLTHDRVLPASLGTTIVERSDGIPLFLEEQVKAIYETHQGKAFQASEAPDEFPGHLDIPTSLRGLLTARLDRLGAGKTIAQVAAVIGREFSAAVLSAIVPFNREDLSNGLNELLQTGIICPSSDGSKSSFAFRHSLLQEAAYQIQLRSKRQSLHDSVARAYLTELPRIVDTQPEIVAHHFEMAGESWESARYWLLAGKRAREQSAYQEASFHFRKGLRQLEALPASPERYGDEIRTLVALGSTLIATHGYAAPEVRTVYYRASELSEKIGHPRELIASLNGLLAFLQVRGPLSEALTLATRIAELAKDTEDPVLLAGAYRRLGWSCFCFGRIADGREYLTRASKLYEPTMARAYVDVHNADPRVLGLINLAWVESFSGQVGRAAEYARQSRCIARELGHPLSLAYALTMSAAVSQGLGKVEEVGEFAAEAIELSAKNAFSYWGAWATTFRGWAITHKGQLDAGMKDMIDGLKAYEDTGARLFKPYVLTLVAEVHQMHGGYSEGLAYLDEATACSVQAEVRFYDAEILRVRGKLMDSMGDRLRAGQFYERAIELAEIQGAELICMRVEAIRRNQ
jgi:class 3 adenylate cyclase/tetratricopeptide (TPR) repeat protein